MKYLIFNVLILNIFFGCTQKVYRPYIDDYTNEPIVDYNQKSHENKILLDKINKNYNEQTIIFLDEKIIDVKTFKELQRLNQLKVVKILTESQEVEKLGYSFAKIKTIIITIKQ